MKTLGWMLHICTVVNVLLSRKLERKANLSIANPKVKLETTKPKKQISRQEQKNKPILTLTLIVSKPKPKTD